MRLLAPFVAAAVLTGCLGGLGGRDRGGWSVFEGGISCRDCERLVEATPDDVFEIDRSWPFGAGQRMFGWYESPIPANTSFVLTWTAPSTPSIETRSPGGESWTAHEHRCEADRPARPIGNTTPTPGLDMVTCVWRFTTTETLDAPRNGISIVWEIHNPGPAASVRFTADHAP